MRGIDNRQPLGDGFTVVSLFFLYSEGVFFNADKIYRALVELEFSSPPYAAPGGTIYQPGQADLYFPQGNDWGPCQSNIHSSLSAVHHAYGLDKELSRNGTYWENLYAIRSLELQNRFDDGHMYANAEECTYNLREEQMTHETALAIWAKWTVLQNDFKITKDAPKQ